MDWAAVVGVIAIIVTIFNGVVGYWVKQASDTQQQTAKDQKQLENDLRSFEVKVAETYVSKTDYHRDIDDIKNMLTKIFDKLDTKADRV